MNDNVVRVRELSKTFDHVRVLDRISLDINKTDRIVALTGPNAAGKTTFFNILTGVERPDSSSQTRVDVLGQPVLRMQPWEVARLGVARLFQDARVFLDLTLLQNVQVAGNAEISSSWWSIFRRPHGDRASLDALAYVGLSERCNEPASILSLGDRRKLAIACMLRSQAQFLLLDEPTANLDKSTTKQIKELVKRLAEEDRTIFIIEHNHEFVEDVANVIFTLHQGHSTREPSLEGLRLD